MRKDLMAPTDWIQEYKTDPIPNLIFLVRLPGPNNGYQFLREVEQMITKTCVDEIGDWHQLKSAPFPKSLFVNETKANKQPFEELKALVDAGHSARAFIRSVPFTTCGQEEFVLAFGHIVNGRGARGLQTAIDQSLSTSLPLEATPPVQPIQAIQPIQPERTIQVTTTKEGKVNVSLKQDFVLPCGALSRLSTAGLNVDANGAPLKTPEPYATGARPKWIHTVRLWRNHDPFMGTIDMITYPATPAFFLTHFKQMKPVEFPSSIQIKAKRPNMVKLEKIRKRIRDGCFAQAFHHTWKKHQYLVLAFTDTQAGDMQEGEAEPESELSAPETKPVEETETGVETEPGADEPESMDLVGDDDKETRKHRWLSLLKGNGTVSHIKKMVPERLRQKWHEYELKAIQAMAPEFIAVHFNQLVSQ